MRFLPLLAILLAAIWFLTTIHAQTAPTQPATQPSTQPASALGFTVKDIDGRDVDLAKYKGQVVLLVNVASKCGLTPQYADLQKLYEQNKDKGFVILAFPANNFNGQEPGSNEQIKTFCSEKYDVTFPLFAKISVKGADITPLYKYLIAQKTAPQPAGDITWNFEKFLLARDGTIQARFAPRTKPNDPALTKAVETALAQPKP